MTTSPIRIVIVDDHPVVRHGLKVLLGTDPGLEVVGEAGGGLEAIGRVEELRPDVVLMDLVMPEMDGAETSRRLLARHPDIRILVLTSYGSDEKLFPALDAGVLGFMLKDSTAEQLVHSIRQVSRGLSSLSPAIARRLVREVSQDSPGAGRVESLTARETEVLREVAHGLSNDEIGARLFISPTTVRTHLTSIFAKLNLTRRTQAVLFALRHGIARLEDTEPGA